MLQVGLGASGKNSGFDSGFNCCFHKTIKPFMDTQIAFRLRHPGAPIRSKMPTVLEVLISLLLQLFWKILNDKTSKTIYFHAIVCNVTPRAKWWTYFLLQTAKYPYDVLRQRRIIRINAQRRQKQIKTFYPPPEIIPHGVESTSYIWKIHRKLLFRHGE